MGMPARVFALAFGLVMTAGCGAKADGSAGTPLASSSAASSALAAQRSEDQAPLADKTGGFDGKRRQWVMKARAEHVKKCRVEGPEEDNSGYRKRKCNFLEHWFQGPERGGRHISIIGCLL